MIARPATGIFNVIDIVPASALRSRLRILLADLVTQLMSKNEVAREWRVFSPSQRLRAGRSGLHRA